MDIGFDQRLSGLLRLDIDSAEPWSELDLRQMVRHQMRSPLMVDLSPTEGAEAGGRYDIASFRDLFAAASPPLALLILTKNFAKASLGTGGRTLPPEIAHLLYYLSIATAHIRLGESISALSRDDLMEGISWCLDQQWVDEPTREMLTTCRTLI